MRHELTLRITDEVVQRSLEMLGGVQTTTGPIKNLTCDCPVSLAIKDADPSLDDVTTAIFTSSFNKDGWRLRATLPSKVKNLREAFDNYLRGEIATMPSVDLTETVIFRS